MRRRSNLMVLAGIAFFVVGAAIVVLVSRGGDGGSNNASATETDVLVAKETLNAGTTGDDVLKNGLVEVKRVDINTKQADALITPSQLSNTTLTRTFTKGEQITQSGLAVRSALAQAVTIPDGFEAVAVNTPFVAGGAGYIAPGDLVNVFTVVPELKATDAAGSPVDLSYSAPRTELLLTNVRVLDVQTEVAPFRSTASGTSATDGTAARTSDLNSITLLLAVSTVDAEKLIFSSTAGNFVYVSRVANDSAPPAQTTPGVDYPSLFNEEPGAAHNRSGTAAL